MSDWSGFVVFKQTSAMTALLQNLKQEMFKPKSSIVWVETEVGSREPALWTSASPPHPHRIPQVLPRGSWAWSPTNTIQKH